jgi:hypothetical protein
MDVSMWKPFPLKIFRGEQDQLLYKRTSLSSVEGDDAERSKTLAIYTVIFSIVTCNTSTKA